MSAAILRYNPERTFFELVSPEGEEFEVAEVAEDFLSINEGDVHQYLVVHRGADMELLKPDTVYRLVEVLTTVEEGVDLSEDSVDVEDGDDEEGDDEDEPETAA